MIGRGDQRVQRVVRGEGQIRVERARDRVRIRPVLERRRVAVAHVRRALLRADEVLEEFDRVQIDRRGVAGREQDVDVPIAERIAGGGRRIRVAGDDLVAHGVRHVGADARLLRHAARSRAQRLRGRLRLHDLHRAGVKPRRYLGSVVGGLRTAFRRVFPRDVGAGHARDQPVHPVEACGFRCGDDVLLVERDLALERDLVDARRLRGEDEVLDVLDVRTDRVQRSGGDADDGGGERQALVHRLQRADARAHGGGDRPVGCVVLRARHAQAGGDLPLRLRQRALRRRQRGHRVHGGDVRQDAGHDRLVVPASSASFVQLGGGASKTCTQSLPGQE